MTSEAKWIEADIVINGVKLTLGQSMTVRVALQNMASTLVEDGLGDDPNGKSICEGYLRAISQINSIMW